MMIIPSKKHQEMREIVEPWLFFNSEKFVLKPEAPQEAKEAWGWLKKHPIKYELD